jgi:hypothetical protein
VYYRAEPQELPRKFWKFYAQRSSNVHASKGSIGIVGNGVYVDVGAFGVLELYSIVRATTVLLGVCRIILSKTAVRGDLYSSIYEPM